MHACIQARVICPGLLQYDTRHTFLLEVLEYLSTGVLVLVLIVQCSVVIVRNPVRLVLY
jgi:hypothetical protein